MKRLLPIVLFSVAVVAGQDTLKLNQPVERDLPPGTPQSYTIQVTPGDYVAGSIDQHGKADMAVILPDGSRLRRFPAAPEDGKRSFAFVAETAGTYRLELTTTATQPVHYLLRLEAMLSLNERLKPAAPEDASPRIQALRTQVTSGKADLEAFWRQVANEGTPLVEAIDKDARRQFVTFLWRGGPDTHNVLVAGSFQTGGGALQDRAMRQLAGTDVWYLTVKLPLGARFMYALSPNDPMVIEGSRAAERQATMQADPLNSHRWGCPADASKYACQSMGELPGAVPQPWIVRNSGTPAGEVHKHTIKSAILNNERNLSVYTPPGYKTDGKPYRLLVVFDEGAYLDRVPTPVILDNLLAASKIPPMVAVLIANPSQETRNKELPPNADFADFLAKELIPWIHANYHVTSDPQSTVVAGSSYGGIAATYAGLRHSEVFGNVLCQSGSFWWAPDHTADDSGTSTETGWLAKEFIKSPKLPLRFYMDAGSFEYDTSGGGGAILEPSRHMRDVLLAKGYEVHYQQFIGGHDYLSWRGTLADGLMDLMGDGEAEAARR